MELHLHIHHYIHIPQLSSLEETLREGMTHMGEAVDRLTQAITDTMNDLTTALDTELTEIADALTQAGGDPALIDVQTQRLLSFRDSFRQRVVDIIPATPPPAP